MRTYVVRRIGLLIVIVFIAFTANFLIPRLIPGDPIQAELAQQAAITGNQGVNIAAAAKALDAKFQLDKPVWQQYLAYWDDLFHLDLGYSIQNYPETVGSEIRATIFWTFGLLGFSILVAFVIGCLLGAALAWPTAPRVIRALGPFFMVLGSIPQFLIGLALIFAFATILRILPGGGVIESTQVVAFNFSTIFDILHHSILPAAALILGLIGSWAVGMRGMMISVLGEDYILFAEAKGLSPGRVFLWYGMRNALLPQLTGLAVALGTAVSGAILVEVVFNYPGVGFLLFQAISQKDYFTIQGVVLVLIATLALTLFIVDILYPFIDPRVRYEQ
ncbi:MAG TPA: ABC transporter permease [Candidatus Dormibacteraeota bacterium]|jgi:peptide/nickel transport system permease protein|nr:ABC transporter permease [Candidatus Dormibacteraeota bacterium]